MNPDANHLQIFFAVMNDERKNVVRDASGAPQLWAVEMAGSAQEAEEGITVDSFPPGTVFSIAMHPLRTGGPGRRPREPWVHVQVSATDAASGGGSIATRFRGALHSAPDRCRLRRVSA